MPLESEDPLATLSTQLVSHGYITRPLSLSSLFLTPPLPSSSSTSSLKSHQSLLLSKARAQDQLTKLLWNLLERSLESRQELRECVEREGRLEVEWEREKGLRERSEREKVGVERELECEKARCKELEQKLKIELDRGRVARDDANKSRNALAFIRTQSNHEQKKRDQELSSLHLRLSKLTTDTTQTKFLLLNPSITSPPTRTNTNKRSPTHLSNTSNELQHLESEIMLLKAALEESELVREELRGENKELRSFVGELGEWVEKLLYEEKELDLLGNPNEDEEEGEMDQDKREAIELLLKLRDSTNEDGSDQSFSIPTPHFSLPTQLLLPQLHQKLYALRLTLLVSLRSVESRIEREKLGAEEQVRIEIEARDEEREKREELERELEEVKMRLEEGNQLVEQFVKSSKPRMSNLIVRDDSGDELPVEIAKELEKTKQALAAKKLNKTSSSKLTNAAIDKPLTSNVPRISEPPSKSVADFLGSLGLDTPVFSGVGNEKEPLKSERIEGSRRSSGSGEKRVEDKAVKRRVSAERGKEREKEGEFKKPSLSKKPSSNRLKPSPPTTSSSTSPSASSTTTNRPSPPPPSATPATSSALESILSLSLSPPTSNESAPLISSQLAGSKEVEKKVLGTSRAVNGAEGESEKGKKTREELVREKKLSLMNKGSMAGVRGNVK